MRISRLIISLSLMTFSLSCLGGTRNYASYVNPFVGTDGHGHTTPAAVYPFGMVQVGPDTRTLGWDGCSGYHYTDSIILGFTHTHLSGTGCADWCDILFMPVIGEKVVSGFSHSNETASPGYYQVWLDDPGVNVRIAAGKRMAMHEYTFPEGSQRTVWMDLKFKDRLIGVSYKKVGPNAIEGWRQSRAWAYRQDVYFYAEFSSDIVSEDVVDSASVRLGFGQGKDPLKIKIALSSVSCANAKANLLCEKASDDWNFESLLSSTVSAWNEWLSRIDVTGNEQDCRTFYTSLYHCAVHPSLYSDSNGEYRGMDRKVHKAEGFDRYTVFSVWDVFRATFPLYEMIAREYMPDFLESMLSIYKESGRLPIWELSGWDTECMIGYNSASIITDAFVKGTLPKERLREYYEAMKRTAANFDEGQKLFDLYGYDPAWEDDQNVSKTLEYAYDSWCIARIAEELGEREDYKLYIERAQYWKNVFDPVTGFMRPREFGRWVPDFNPYQPTSHFTEANSWHYSYFVPHDIAGHIELIGGQDAFQAKLDSLFIARSDGFVEDLVDLEGFIGQYVHGNEPSHHTAFLYDFAGQPWKTQELSLEICRKFYSDQPYGLCGNEDCGQMSAWYVLSSIGMYCVTPGTTVTALTTPVFKKASINLGDRTFTIKASGAGKTYIQKASLNGKKYDAAAIDFKDIIGGGTLEFKLGDKPSEFGKTPVMVTSISPEYRYDANFEPDFGQAKKDTFVPTIKIFPQTKCNGVYTAGGDNALADGKRGKKNWRAGGWQGYKHTDIDVIVDLLGRRTISEVSAGFIQDMNNYIWMPRDMEVYVSEDGKNFTLAGSRPTDMSIEDETVKIEEWSVTFAPVEAAFVRVVAHHFGEIPSWHRGYGDTGYTFIDEITVK